MKIRVEVFQVNGRASRKLRGQNGLVCVQEIERRLFLYSFMLFVKRSGCLSFQAQSEIVLPGSSVDE